MKELSEALERGTAPWQKPWREVKREWPVNAATGDSYGWHNAMRLFTRAKRMGYTDPRWITYNQAENLGWHVKLGEKGTRIVFCAEERKPVKDENGRYVRNPDGTIKYGVFGLRVMRPYFVFNGSQVAGISPYRQTTQEHESPEECEKAERILSESGAEITFGGDQAYYDFVNDYIGLPKRFQFSTKADYYATALHELTHWTGHESRLNRGFSVRESREDYAFEELVAEIGSMFVSAETGIDQTQEHFENHAAYVGSWIKHIKSDNQAYFRAVRLAEKAAEYILRNEREREKLNKAS
ncbi:MAG: DUF1738 domain-containing protein [Synergistaceae bacterium]|nr:DUF1738 domain-containing protein [Synergistaceae bacterium]